MDKTTVSLPTANANNSMGQQQLLLLVMGIVIVGLAVLAGLAAAEKSFMQQDADALVNRCLHIAQDAVYWKAKTDPLEERDTNYAGLSSGGFGQLLPGNETDRGEFQITTATDDSLVITAISKRFPEVGVKVSVVGEEIVDTDLSFNGAITLN